MDWMNILLWIACALQAYLLGSISFAYVIGKLAIRRDIRKYGSGNAGATNMIRNFGWRLGLLTFVCDFAKGIAAVLIGGLIAGNVGSYIAAVLAVAGHNWPVFFEFKGGKGAATTLGVTFMLMPLQACGILVVSVAAILMTKFVSVGSLTGGLVMLLSGFIFFQNDIPFQICAGILFLLVVFSHRENIQRLISGTESKMSLGKGRPQKRAKDKAKAPSVMQRQQ